MAYSSYFNDVPTFANYFPLPPVKPSRPRPVSFPPATIPKLNPTSSIDVNTTGLYRVLNFQFRNHNGLVKTANLYKILCKPKHLSQRGFYELIFTRYIIHLHNLVYDSDLNRFYSDKFKFKLLKFAACVAGIELEAEKNKTDYEYYLACVEIVKEFVRIFSRQ